jgi:hypothetical protein
VIRDLSGNACTAQWASWSYVPARRMAHETYVTVTLAAQQIERVEQSCVPAVPVRSSSSTVCAGTESADDGGRAYVPLSIRGDISRHCLVLDCWLDCDYLEKIPEDILPGVTSKKGGDHHASIPGSCWHGVSSRVGPPRKSSCSIRGIPLSQE